ncbi:thermonuclease family protein [Bacillus thuringiensis]|uniref:thermonuclease family protein n=1 Tax=Bacillus thuringiensis TaxID=1428 RepID=UPI001642EE3F|nr:thermonuclease family protein [Bacillus thuringiensis]
MKKWLSIAAATSILLIGCTTTQETKTSTTQQVIAPDGLYNKVKDLEKVQAKVKKVVDGDTIIVDNKGQEKKVRMLLLDTPESVKPNEAPMPYGKEASHYTKQLLEGKIVELVYDKGQKQDHYQRDLAYVFLNGKCVESEILREGLGIVRYVKEPNTTLYEDFKQAQEEAKKEKKGVWSKNGYVTQKGKETSYN